MKIERSQLADLHNCNIIGLGRVISHIQNEIINQYRPLEKITLVKALTINYYIQLDHIWISDPNLLLYPLNQIIYFQGLINLYRKLNFKTLSYGILEFKMISKQEYDANRPKRKQYQRLIVNPQLQKAMNEKINSI